MAIIDNKEIYISYYIGKDISDNKSKYTEPHIIYANVSEPVSYENIDNIGRIPDYDRTLIIDVGENTEFLREDSVLWIDTIPNTDKDNFDYVIARVGDVKYGKVKVYCNAISPNTQFLYYSTDGENIYQVKVFYDNLVAIVPKNMYFPITGQSLIWYIKPASVETTNAKINMVSKTENVNTYTYTFEVDE